VPITSLICGLTLLPSAIATAPVDHSADARAETHRDDAFLHPPPATRSGRCAAATALKLPLAQMLEMSTAEAMVTARVLLALIVPTVTVPNARLSGAIERSAPCQSD